MNHIIEYYKVRWIGFRIRRDPHFFKLPSHWKPAGSGQSR